MPVLKEVGELVYAGGKQTGEQVEILVIKEVGQSYLTKLWNKEEMQHDATEKKVSFVHLLSRYFTYIVFSIALLTAIYWQMYNPEKIWPAVTAIFIIACPCALLLSNTFTNGNVLRILGHNRFYLRSASVIEAIAATTHIVFDKTGTLTSSYFQNINYNGCPLTKKQEQQIAALAANSNHPLSRALAMHLSPVNLRKVSGFKEVPGEGIEGIVDDDLIKLGTETFVTGSQQASPSNTVVYVWLEGQTPGYFSFGNSYRDEMPALIQKLKSGYKLSVLSGDNEASMQQLQRLMGKNTTLLFHQKPEDKLNYIKHLQQSGESVMMIGDGLNDAGALKQSDVGIAVTEQANNFTPSSDAIIEAGQLPRLTKFFKLCSANKNIVVASFVLSIVYNVVGLFFAVQGILSPLVAAILMPSSSLSILLLTFGSSSLIAKKMGLLSVKKT